MEKDYYIGIDGGTNSVGWAVTDSAYHICKFNGKAMWGIRLFEAAKTAEARRMKRTTRRRLSRRKQRIDLLQELFKEEIGKVDETFFIRLNESRLHPEDKSANTAEIQLLFVDAQYTDADYYKEYPTIYHLRKDLIENKNRHDIRQVYLALHHILKYRGHFLIEGTLGDARSFHYVYERMREAIEDIDDGLGITLIECEEKLLETALSESIPNSVKAKKISDLLQVDANSCIDSEEIKRKKAALEHICKLIVGNKGDLKKVFDTKIMNIEKSSISFAEPLYEETVKPELEELYPETAYIVDCIKGVYDWTILTRILGNEKTLSSAKVKEYERHHENLRKLKEFVKKYCSGSVYKEFFEGQDEKKISYSRYIGMVKHNGKKIPLKKCTEDEFYKELKNILENITPDQEDSEQYHNLVEQSNQKKLLPLQRSKENGTIPKQVHEAELRIILKNAEGYLTFLNESDEDGITIADKIISIFNFRVPYYVGPLSLRHADQGANVWVERKEVGYIYPWNFSRKVDEEKSNENFIERMTNKCTYLIGEDVLPKMSLTYSKYMVLNELNCLKIRGRNISVEMKQQIYTDLFQNHIHITGKKLLEYLQQSDSELSSEDLSGFDIDFKATLSPWLDFRKKIFGHRIAEDYVKHMAEDIIRWKTIYGDDWKMVETVIKKYYDDELSGDELKKLKALHYSGWGRFSNKFLNEIVGADRETGEMFTIMEALWKTNNTLMQLLSANFTFAEEIEKINKEKLGIVTEISYDALVKDLFTSPSTKRTIWQAIQIVEEIKKIKGYPPKKIFVEMARGAKEKVRTKSRKMKLLELYEACKRDTRNWSQELGGRDWCKEIEALDERKFNSIKLYLYYTQMGRCMYTGEPINLEELMSGNMRWDRDHIYPQSKVKDDSLDNLVLVDKTNNSKKSDKLIPREIQEKQGKFWRSLLKMEFISQKKYDRLMRQEDFTTDELGGFISRQLVETQQSSKLIVDLLKQLYEAEGTKVIPVKAGIVSEFRKNDLNRLKSRRINDYHHAKDAYLNIVAGNVYDRKFTANPSQWVKNEKKRGVEKPYNLQRIFDYDVPEGSGEEKIWKGPDGNGKRNKETGEKEGGSLELIRKTLKRNDILYTEYSYCGTGQLFDETIVSKEKTALIPLKKELDTSKYGGYTSANTSYFALIEFDGKKGQRVRNLIEVPIYIANQLSHNSSAYREYCENIKRLKNVVVLKDCIKKNALLEIDGYPMRIRGANETSIMLKNNIQLVLNNHEETIRRIEKYLEKNSMYEVDPVKDGFTEATLGVLYKELAYKLKTVYAKRPANQSSILEQGEEKFYGLSLKEKAKVINQIIIMMRCDIETKGDLSAIGGSKNAGSIKINKNTIGKSKLVLVNQSVTGLFENRVEL